MNLTSKQQQQQQQQGPIGYTHLLLLVCDGGGGVRLDDWPSPSMNVKLEDTHSLTETDPEGQTYNRKLDDNISGVK